MELSRPQITMSAVLLAALVVVGVILWLTYTPDDPTAEESQSISVEVIATPTPTAVPTPVEGSISEEAIAFVPVESPAVMGVSTSAPTGPTENALAAIAAMILVGFGGSLFLAKLS